MFQPCSVTFCTEFLWQKSHENIGGSDDALQYRSSYDRITPIQSRRFVRENGEIWRTRVTHVISIITFFILNNSLITHRFVCINCKKHARAIKKIIVVDWKKSASLFFVLLEHTASCIFCCSISLVTLRKGDTDTHKTVVILPSRLPMRAKKILPIRRRVKS